MRFHLRLLYALLTAFTLAVAAGPVLAEDGNDTDDGSSGSGDGDGEDLDDEEDDSGDGNDELEADGDDGNEGSDDDGNGTDDDSDDGSDDDQDDDEDKGDDEDEEDEEDDIRDELGGDFALSGGIVEGRSVTFNLTDLGVENYTVGGVLVFKGIVFEPALDADEVDAEHGEFKAEGDESEFKAVDTPNGHFKAEAEEGIRLVLAEGWAVAPTSDNSGHGNDRLRLEGPAGRIAFLNGEDGIEIMDNLTVWAPEEVRFILHAPGQTGELSPEIDEAIEDGRVAGEILVRDGHAITIEHGDVNMTVLQEDGLVEIEVEGEGEGKTFVFTVGPGTLGDLDGFEVSFDGAPIGRASDMADILDAQPDEPAEYLILVGANATQVLVQVPHFSVHTIQLQSVASAAHGISGSWMVFAAAGVVAVAFIAVTVAARARHR